MRRIRIGAGAGYSGDRIDPAIELAEKGAISYLVFECLAERTIALAQRDRLLDPLAGYDPLLEERMEAVLPLCAQNKIRVISNMGAANPLAAASKTRDIARRLGLSGLRIAAVTGDDVLAIVRGRSFALNGDQLSKESLAHRILSANAYVGVEPIVDALRGGADVILTGRVADPSLFLAPQIHEFGWALDDWDRLGQGTVVGHLLECAGQLTGGYFADPGYKDVPHLAYLGFPIAEIEENGTAVVTKVEGSGGRLTRASCAEQLLYEIEDPNGYMTPDVTADFSAVSLSETGRDRVAVCGGRGKPRPAKLKVSLGCQDGYVGEGQISYAGPGARERAELAKAVLVERLKLRSLQELRFDLIGFNSIHGDKLAPSGYEPPEVRLRVVARSDSRREASIVPREVEALYTNGPAGGGGVTTSIKETIGILSTLVPREMIQPEVHIEDV